jgi:predicted regulator of amino acid metabolism with ACT domain
MGTVDGYSQPVSRFPTELNAEQQQALDALKHAVEKIRQTEAEYTQLLVTCKRLEIPIKRIAEEIGVERKTIYNQLGRAAGT